MKGRQTGSKAQLKYKRIPSIPARSNLSIAGISHSASVTIYVTHICAVNNNDGLLNNHLMQMLQ